MAKGDAMEHYSKHALIALTAEEQDLVNRVSLNIYRPCCNNPTYFPDCNHGMAMLGLLELMAAQGLVNGPAAHLESWTAFVRAGASIIITYGARYAQEWIKQ